MELGMRENPPFNVNEFPTKKLGTVKVMLETVIGGTGIGCPPCEGGATPVLYPADGIHLYAKEPALLSRVPDAIGDHASNHTPTFIKHL
jgi:hypothetical protein